ncbi:hypothetical protein L1987_77568 [Smallanthus sonchifolius]|uniref:Uncharacterized protein n=1 Tax=Smallanthus sonchifolius TaxID=185202 RepID=A0ACB8ZB87_9ASTR|nr:hypothetical protein L1987_77568 [Smallanthus sonchifolius]
MKRRRKFPVLTSRQLSSGYLRHGSLAISDDLSLVRNPDQTVLEHLFAIKEVRNGLTACKTIPLLVDLLRPMPDKPDTNQWLNQLIVVLHLGSRISRLSAARALHQLFDGEDIRESELALHAFQPLIDMLNAASESEQEAALLTLIKLILTDTGKAVMFLDMKGNPLESLYKILSCSSLYSMVNSPFP